MPKLTGNRKIFGIIRSGTRLPQEEKKTSPKTTAPSVRAGAWSPETGFTNERQFSDIRKGEKR